MKHHTWLRAVAAAAIMLLVAAAIVHPSTSGMAARLATASAAFQAFWHWLRGAATHVTTTQLVEAAALAWLVFVFSLVLLARSRPTEQKEQEPHLATSPAATVPDITQPLRVRATRAVPETFVSPLPVRHVVDHDSVGQVESTREAPPTRSTGGAAAVLAAPDLPAEPAAELKEQSAHPDGASSGWATRQTRRHLLALSGVSLAQERSLPYGLFIVAEETGYAPSAGNSSRRVVEGIAEQIAPALATDPTLGISRFAALLKLAVLRAGIDLRQRGIRAASDLCAAVTAILVVGDVVHVVTLGECRGVWAFRPREGLMQVAADQTATTRLAETGPRRTKTLYMHASHDTITLDVGSGQEASDLTTFEAHLHPDDLLLLGSPGLWQALRRPQIEGILGGAADSRSAAEMLAHTARKQAEAQDVSVIVVHPLEDWMPAFGIAAA